MPDRPWEPCSGQLLPPPPAEQRAWELPVQARQRCADEWLLAGRQVALLPCTRAPRNKPWPRGSSQWQHSAGGDSAWGCVSGPSTASGEWL